MSKYQTIKAISLKLWSITHLKGGTWWYACVAEYSYYLSEIDI